MLAASSPELFVGRHVLLRLCVPRYPPSALIRLTTLVLLQLVLAVATTIYSCLYAVFKVHWLELFQHSHGCSISVLQFLQLF